MGNGLCFYELDCEFGSEEEALKNMLADALALLREKDARIKELEEAVGAEFTCFVGDPHKVDRCPYVDELVKKDTEIARLTEDNERLHASCTELERNRASLNDENERLKVELKKRPPKLIITKLNKKDQIAKEMEEGKDDDHKGG
jgi:hypothetical protein